MNKNILRVFPSRTSCTPDDDMVWIGLPGLFVPEHEEVHISCVFTWDIDYCEYLLETWREHTDKPVYLGGPAYGSKCDEHTPGLYTKAGIIFTSRGCNNKCPWCLVPKREGRLQELEVKPGHIINDNNFLQCSERHQEKVFEMLGGQKNIQFKGGLECGLVTREFAKKAREVKTSEIWLACDTDSRLPDLKKAAGILQEAGFTRNHIHCYVLIGRDMDKEEKRLQEIYKAGCMPFAQLYKPVQAKEYSVEWKRFARQWSRAAAVIAHVEKGTTYKTQEANDEQFDTL